MCTHFTVVIPSVGVYYGLPPPAVSLGRLHSSSATSAVIYLLVSLSDLLAATLLIRTLPQSLIIGGQMASLSASDALVQACLLGGAVVEVTFSRCI